jgi:hypothetical protein
MQDSSVEIHHGLYEYVLAPVQDSADRDEDLHPCHEDDLHPCHGYLQHYEFLLNEINAHPCAQSQDEPLDQYDVERSAATLHLLTAI